LEGIERLLVLEEDDLPVGLATELQADRDLRHGAGADGGAALENGAVAPGPADPDRSLRDLGEHGIAIGLLEEDIDAWISRLETGERRPRPLFAGSIPGARAVAADDDRQTRKHHTRNQVPHHGSSSTAVRKTG